jgi:hypothetical protein
MRPMTTVDLVILGFERPSEVQNIAGIARCWVRVSGCIDNN